MLILVKERKSHRSIFMGKTPSIPYQTRNYHNVIQKETLKGKNPHFKLEFQTHTHIRQGKQFTLGRDFTLVAYLYSSINLNNTKRIQVVEALLAINEHIGEYNH